MNRVAVATVLTACAVLGCRQQSPALPQSAGPPRLVHPDELTEPEKRYGHSATLSEHVTYQPDVVLLAAGAGAIRSVSADGLVWTIDPEANGADGIQPGKVLVLTSRATGRVLAVNKASAGLQVVLGPVEITDIVREGTFSLDQPVDLEQAIQVTMPDLFDPQMIVDPIQASATSPHRHRILASPAAFTPVRQTTVHRFTLTPLVGARGIGVRIASDAGGVHFLGEAVLYLNAPRLRFNCPVLPPGRIHACELELTGAAGLLMTFEAASPTPMSANINEKRYVPIDFSIPITGMGVPFAVNVRQLFELKTAFTSTGTVRGRGYYTLQGGLRVGYRNGSWSMGGPQGVTPKENLEHLLMSMEGAAFGVTGLVMTHQVNVIVGIGYAGFATGPYGFLNSSVAVTRGSSIGILQGPLTCKQATLTMALGAGVGYVIPQPVTNAINSILRALNIREQIQGSGGFDTKPIQLVNLGYYHPALPVCGG